MPDVEIIDEFSAAHNLRNYKGKCEELHGHNWRVGITVRRKGVGKNGMVMDFAELKKVSKDVLSELDHRYLNGIKYFKTHNPTSENIAEFVAVKLKRKLKPPLILKEVRIWETERNCAIWP